MKEKKGCFKGLDIEKCWLPFTANLIDASNMAMQISNGDDVKYCQIMMGAHELMQPLYVGKNVMDIYTYDRMFQVFIYVFEFIYGDPNCTGIKGKPFVGVEEFFKDIRKNWYVDIGKKLES